MMNQKLSPDSILRTCSDVHFRRVLDEAVVIRQQSAETLVLNEVAISVLEKDSTEPVFGAVWFAARVETDRDAREVILLEG